MKKKNWIILIIVLVIVSVLIVFIKTDANVSKKESTNCALSAIELFTNSTISKKEAEKTLKVKINSPLIVGKDSILREKPNSKIIKKYNLQNYETIQTEKAKIIDKAFQNNLAYHEESKLLTNESQTVYTMSLTSFYYQNFVNDYLALSSEIFTGAGFEFLKEDTIDNQVAYYKASVKALEIMAEHVNDYKNITETINFDVYCENNKLVDESEVNNLLTNLKGTLYTSASLPKEKTVKNYYNEAKEKGMLENLF